MIRSHTTETRSQGGKHDAPQQDTLLLAGCRAETRHAAQRRSPVIMHTPAPMRDTVPDHWNFPRFLATHAASEEERVPVLAMVRQRRFREAFWTC